MSAKHFACLPATGEVPANPAPDQIERVNNGNGIRFAKASRVRLTPGRHSTLSLLATLVAIYVVVLAISIREWWAVVGGLTAIASAVVCVAWLADMKKRKSK